MLGAVGIDPRGAAANALSTPPGEYGRKAKTQRNSRGPAQAVEHVVQFDYAQNLTWVKSTRRLQRCGFALRGASEKVLHGCRQLVS